MEALPFVVEQVARLPRGRAIDVACGTGRHLPVLLAHGMDVTGVDRDAVALQDAARRAPGATLFVRDVERDGLPPELGAAFTLVLTTYFLHRPLIPELVRVLAPGGYWLLETFHVDNHLQRGHPRRRHYTLEPGEADALARAAGLDVIHVHEGEHGEHLTVQLLARKP